MVTKTMKDPNVDLSDIEPDILDDLFDTSMPPQNSDELNLNSWITDKEREEDALIYNQFKRGVMLVIGEPGAGKETWMHYLLYKLRRLYKGFTVMLDRKPRPAFGKYTLINEEVLMDEFTSLNQKYKTGEASIVHDFARFSKHKEKLNDIMKMWHVDNKELFYNAGMGLTEFWRYFYNRDPHNPMNKTISPLFKRYRHHDLLVIGTAPQWDELDIKSCLKHLTHVIECSQTGVEGWHQAVIHRRRYFNGRMVEVVTDERPPIFYYNGLEPREDLNGHCIYDLFNSFERDEKVPRVKFKT